MGNCRIEQPSSTRYASLPLSVGGSASDVLTISSLDSETCISRRVVLSAMVSNSQVYCCCEAFVATYPGEEGGIAGLYLASEAFTRHLELRYLQELHWTSLSASSIGSEPLTAPANEKMMEKVDKMFQGWHNGTRRKSLFRRMPGLLRP